MTRLPSSRQLLLEVFRVRLVLGVLLLQSGEARLVGRGQALAGERRLEVTARRSM